jgi:hypothetical protein
LAESVVGGVQTCGDRSCSYAEDLGDAPIIEIGVVAQKEHEPLTLREDSHKRCKFQTFLSMRQRSIHRHRRLMRLRLTGVVPPLLARRIDDRAPHPRFERCLTAKIAAASHHRRKSILNDLARALPLTQNRRRNSHEVGKPLAIERLDLGHQICLGVRHF